MAKMKGEWENVRFNCQPYRESGVSILSGVDDIQVFRDVILFISAKKAE